MEQFRERIAKYSESRERRILGYTLEECIRLKFPPGRVTLQITEVPYRISRSSVLPNDLTRWLVSNHAERNHGLHVQRGHDEDAYSINDIRYTHHFNYETGHVRVYHPETHQWEEWWT